MNCYPKRYEARVLMSSRGSEITHTFELVASTIAEALEETEKMADRLYGVVPDGYHASSYYEVIGLRVL